MRLTVQFGGYVVDYALFCVGVLDGRVVIGDEIAL